MKYLYCCSLLIGCLHLTGIAQSNAGTVPSLSGGLIPLNLRLLSFMATTVDAHTNRIQWEVTGFTNATIYHVERSLDGKAFTNIGNVTAITGQSSYNFVDDSVNAAANWYRMEAVQPDGSASSQVVLVRYGQTDYIASLRPSVTHAGVTTLYWGSSRNIGIGLTVIDAGGRMLLRKAFAVSVGGNYISLDLSGLPVGLYYFNMVDDYGKRIVLPFEKL